MDNASQVLAQGVPPDVDSEVQGKTMDAASETTTAGLCDICREIFTQKRPLTTSNGTLSFPHHRNIHDLVKASDNGCRLCGLLLNKLSMEEKLLVRVDLEETSLSEHPLIYYELDDWRWVSGVLCIFTFGTANAEQVRKAICFLPVQDNISAYKRSPEYLEGNENNPRCKLGVTLAYGSDPIPWVQNTNTRSTASLEQAEMWITKCVMRHSICKTGSNLVRIRLPTRLIWVNPSVNGNLGLRDTKHLPQETQYMTLSYCWGKEKVLALTKKSAEKLFTQIEFEELPRTFKDAIEVVRFMGIEYIWIDSLCIIQDSIEDWQKESLLMKDVYTNSYCNIAATHARDSKIGCFVDRNIQSSLRINVPGPYQSCHHFFIPGIYEYRDPNLWENEIESSVLLTRGWVFQERLLAPRTLHFAQSQIFYECQELRACELYPEELVSLREIFENWVIRDNLRIKVWAMLIQASSLQSSDNESLYKRRQIAGIVWMYLVMGFTVCKLSHETDRLIAISGLANLIQPIMECRYLAGLWEDNLVVQLVWVATGESTRAEEYQAPSWSWASKPGETSLYDDKMRDVAGLEGFMGRNPSNLSRELVKVSRSSQYSSGIRWCRKVLCIGLRREEVSCELRYIGRAGLAS